MTDEETKAWRGDLPTFTQLGSGRAPKARARQKGKEKRESLTFLLFNRGLGSGHFFLDRDDFPGASGILCLASQEREGS